MSLFIGLIVIVPQSLSSFRFFTDYPGGKIMADQRPPESSFFEEWSSHFYLLDNGKKFCFRDFERVRKSWNDINEHLCLLLLIFQPLLYVPLQLHRSRVC